MWSRGPPKAAFLASSVMSRLSQDAVGGGDISRWSDICRSTLRSDKGLRLHWFKLCTGERNNAGSSTPPNLQSSRCITAELYCGQKQPILVPCALCRRSRPRHQLILLARHVFSTDANPNSHALWLPVPGHFRGAHGGLASFGSESDRSFCNSNSNSNSRRWHHTCTLSSPCRQRVVHTSTRTYYARPSRRSAASPMSASHVDCVRRARLRRTFFKPSVDRGDIDLQQAPTDSRVACAS